MKIRPSPLCCMMLPRISGTTTRKLSPYLNFHRPCHFPTEYTDEKGRIRKFWRIGASGAATVYFPRMNATLQGQLTDISLTGIGVLAQPPFALEDNELVAITAMGEDGQEYRFECKLWCAVQRDGGVLCGAEFVMDLFIYPKIVRFVYGSHLKMLRSTLNLRGSANATT